MKETFTFDGFVWDPNGPALYYEGQLIDKAGKRSLQVLGVFLRKPNHLISHQEVLDEVWAEDNVSVAQDSVHQAISQLRRIIRSTRSPSPFLKTPTRRSSDE